MEPKYTFELGVNLETVQFGERFIIINSRAMAAEYAEVGDLFSVKMQDSDGIEIELFGFVTSPPDKKTDENGGDSYWFAGTRVNS
jgi:hypothetical protein